MCKNYTSFAKHYKKHQREDEALVLPPAEDVYYVKDNRISDNPTSKKSLEQTLMDNVTTLTTTVPNLIHPKEKSLQQRKGPHLLRFDGGARKNPGPAGAGKVISSIEDLYPFRFETEVYTNSIWLGQKHTNNTAEFVAFIAGMSAAKAMGIESLRVEGDSKLIVDLMNGKTRARTPHIVALYRKAKELMDGFARFGILHVVREKNKRADGLANEAMDLRVNRVWARETGQ